MDISRLRSKTENHKPRYSGLIPAKKLQFNCVSKWQQAQLPKDSLLQRGILFRRSMDMELAPQYVAYTLRQG